MTTLSQLVDEIVEETRRPALRQQISTFVNEVIQELHLHPDHAAAVKFDENLVEALLTATESTGYFYTLPQPRLFQDVEAVWYQTLGLAARRLKPSTVHKFRNRPDGDSYYYRSGPTICFNGYGGTGAQIQLAYYQKPRRLKYYAAGDRPCSWDEETESYSYATAYDSTSELQAQAEELCSNWILMRWKEVVKQGVVAKLFTRAGDLDRAKLAYSSYRTNWPILIATESSHHDLGT